MEFDSIDIFFLALFVGSQLPSLLRRAKKYQENVEDFLSLINFSVVNLRD